MNKQDSTQAGEADQWGHKFDRQVLRKGICYSDMLLSSLPGGLFQFQYNTIVHYLRCFPLYCNRVVTNIKADTINIGN